EVVQAAFGCDLDALEDLAGIAINYLHVRIAAPPTGGGIDLLAVGSDADAVEPSFFFGMLDFPDDLVGLQVEAKQSIVAVRDPHPGGGSTGAGAAGAAQQGHVDEPYQFVAVVDVVEVDALVARAAGAVPRGDVQQSLDGRLLRPSERADQENPGEESQ